jgi:hypothetical protein
MLSGLLLSLHLVLGLFHLLLVLHALLAELQFVLDPFLLAL